ncbi:MAG: alpha-galactosidase [Clostridia bacterium]|nr:alpha-galactosidase [Clostridia bacterium]
MILDYSIKGLNIAFEVTEDKTVILRSFSRSEKQPSAPKKAKFCPIVQLHVSGKDQNDHHGGKHTGTYGSYALKYVSHTAYDTAEGKKVEFLLTDGKLNVTAHYLIYRDITAVRTWNVVTNTSNECVGLEYVSSFAFTGIDEGVLSPNDKLRVYIPHNTWMRESSWQEYTLKELGYYKNNNFSMKRISVSSTGTWPTKEYLPMGAIKNTETESLLIWQIEHNGSWQWEISDIANMLYLQLSGPNEQEHGWYRELDAGETFESVKACLTAGRDFNEALGEMTKYRRTIAKRNDADAKLPIIFNDYMNCLMGDPTEEKEYPMIDRAAALGAEYYVIDAGWYADGSWWDTVGEWQPCEWRFPGGLKKVLDYIKEKGMVPGLWLEPEVMGVNCPLADKFEDECFFMRHGKRVIDHGRYQLDFRNAKVRAHVMSVFDRLVGEYGVGYIKADYNIDAGVGTEVDSDSFGDGLLAHNRALLAFLDEVTAKYPHLVLEYCSSGGMRTEYASLAHAHLQSTSDQTKYTENARIAASAATTLIPEQAAVWAYPKSNDDTDAVAMNMINALPLRIHLSGEIAALDDEKLALMKEAITVYKNIRGDIARSIPFYPLGLPTYGDKQFCAAYDCGGCTRLAVWRLDSDETEIKIPMSGVKEASILYPSASDCAVRMAGNDVTVMLPRRNMAVLIEVK